MINIDESKLVAREVAIKSWLKQNGAAEYLNEAERLLADVDHASLREEFVDEIEGALIGCIENEEIRALDFSWYYGGSPIDVAYAYGLSHGESTGALSNTDLGPKELPGIEIEMEHGHLIDEDFSCLSVYRVFNIWVTELKPVIENANFTNEVASNMESLFTELFQIANYKLGYDACQDPRIKTLFPQLHSRAPFWVTMTRHGRWSVPILVIN